MVSIIVLTWNQRELTSLCLRSLEGSTSVPYELILVDNGSTDGTVDFLKSYSAERRNVRLILNPENVGFARGNNQGMREAAGEYVALLNNDTVLPRMWLERMLEHFEAKAAASAPANTTGDASEAARQPARKPVGMVGPRSNYVKPCQYAQPGYKDLRDYSKFAEAFYAHNRGRSTEAKSLVGFCLVIRREVLDQTGLLEESYAIGGYEDDDLCLRAQRAGYRLLIADDVYVHHFGNASFKGNKLDIVQVAQANRERFIDRWHLRPRIAYVMRWTRLSGGTLVAFRQINDLVERGYPVRVISLEGQPRYFDLKAQVEVVTAFETLPPLDDDIVVVFSALDIPAIAPKCRGKLVHLCQGYEAYHYGSTLEDVLAEKPQMDRFHAIPCARIVVSKHLENLFERKFHQKSFLVPNWVDIGGRGPEPGGSGTGEVRPGTLADAHILFVGRVTSSKGIVDCAAAIRDVRARYPNVTMHVAMPFRLGDLEEEAERPFGKPLVMHYGLNRAEMEHLYRSADLLVSPSWYEGFGLPALEAMACGTPVVTADSPGIREFCRDGDNCLVVPPRQHKKLAGAIEKLIESEDMRRRFAGEGPKTAQGYGHDSSARAIQEAVDTIYRWEVIPPEFRPLPSAASKQVRKGLASVVILTMNELDYTKRCLDTVFAYTPPPFELIIVDNASTDGTWPYLQSVCHKHKNVRLVRNATNLGFATGCNQGILLAEGEHVVLLNNDTLVTRKWLDRLKAALNDVPGAGLAGPVSNYVNGAQRIEGTDAQLRSLPDILKFAEDLALRNAGETALASRLVGFCLLVKRQVFDKIGLFDMAFGLGNFEDDDLCIRARLAGFKCVIARNVFIYHFGGRTFAGNNINYEKHLKENQARFSRKWAALIQPAGGSRITPAAGTEAEAKGDSALPAEGAPQPLTGPAPSAPVIAAESDVAVLEAEGLEHFQARRFEQALTSFETILSQEPGNKDAQYNAGLCCIEMGEARKARRHLNSLLDPREGEETAETYNLIGMSFVLEKDYGAASSCFEKALSLNPAFAEAQENLAFCRKKHG